MEQVQVSAELRQVGKMRASRRLRRTGRVPAVVYGGGKDPIFVSVDDHDMDLILRGASRASDIFNLKIGEVEEQAVLREIQRHPVHNRLVHMDFLRIDLTKEIEVELAIHATDVTPAGVKAGGVLEHLTRELTVRCLSVNLPKYIEVDLSGLEVGESFHVSDLVLPEGVTVLNSEDTTLFAVTVPRAAVEEGEGEGEEPEVIGGKKPEAE